MNRSFKQIIRISYLVLNFLFIFFVTKSAFAFLPHSNKNIIEIIVNEPWFIGIFLSSVFNIFSVTVLKDSLSKNKALKLPVLGINIIGFTLSLLFIGAYIIFSIALTS